MQAQGCKRIGKTDKGPLRRLHKSQTAQGNINKNLIVQLD